jgi:hypothetical protein
MRVQLPAAVAVAFADADADVTDRVAQIGEATLQVGLDLGEAGLEGVAERRDLRQLVGDPRQQVERAVDAGFDEAKAIVERVMVIDHGKAPLDQARPLPSSDPRHNRGFSRDARTRDEAIAIRAAVDRCRFCEGPR